MSDLITQQKAIADIEFLKNTLLKSKEESPVSVVSIDTHFILNVSSFVLAGILMLVDGLGGSITNDILASKTQPGLQIAGLINVAIFLVAVIIASYALVLARAKEENVSLHEFASRDFTYYRKFLIFSDIFIKFFLFSMIILAGQPEWIAAILVIFTADIIIQGRHFYLPLAQSSMMGCICLMIAPAMIFFHASNVSIAFAVFLMVNVISLINLSLLRRKMIRD